MASGIKIIIVGLSYLLIAFLARMLRSRTNDSLVEWIPNPYCQDFRDSPTCSDTLLDSGEEIPADTPTLLIVGGLKTKSRSILTLDYVASLLTFGWLRFREIIPVGEPTDLSLCFQNVSNANFSIEGTETLFLIKYPDEERPSRHWPIRIPDLQTNPDCHVECIENFFTPEIPGAHELIINGVPGLRLAGPYGVAGRRYRIPPAAGGGWRFHFYVSTSYEYRVFIIACAALAISILSFLITIIGRI